MQTLMLPASESSIGRAAEILQSDGVVGFPTETVYGLGGNALSETAAAKIFEAKGRPGDNPLIVHVSDFNQIGPLTLGAPPEAAEKLAKAFWPGPLTMLLKKSQRIPDRVTAGLDTVGIRMPSHPVARALIDKAGIPVAAPSANLSGRPSPTSAAHVLEDMDGRIPLILDGGNCLVGVESTVLDATVWPPRILRPGFVTAEDVARVAGAVEVSGGVLSPLKEGETVRSPGMKYRHYAPRGKVTVVRGPGAPQRLSRLYDEAAAAGFSCRILSLTPHDYGDRLAVTLGDDARAASRALFDTLRRMDEESVERIFAEGTDTAGMGLAFMNRLGRAAAFDVQDAP